MQFIQAPPAVRQSLCSRGFWTASRCYRCTASFAFFGLVLLILLGIFIVGPAIDGLSLKPATCTVQNTKMSDKAQSCSCGKYCSSSFPCLKIYVSYKPKGQDKNVSNVLLHDTVYEHNDYSQCSTAPCERSQDINKMRVKDFEDNYGRPGQRYPCYYNYKKPQEVVTTTENFKMAILHCILWPTLLIVSMIGIMVGMYLYRNRNTPSDGQEVHLVWD
ncbi:calcium-activated potassium channel subunit beta-4 [Exaiptasia diaphana]|uniref:Uncharacterized protein n=1 Tax=Exaiptasia diaphana TaxID=2652724 RepID=A0A913XNM3_EXADI|nr:calcium-activated potassium channel subunit beta-4 [Exaiptasia diaphana]KXJ10248.1 Calcium-activated potassium channel subunit beta-4 [Exaiptasia diaphana]